MNLQSLTILVPQGAEYQAVQRGCRGRTVAVLPLPVGIQPVLAYLHQHWPEGQTRPKRLLVMGLAGSLSPQYQPGDRLLADSCVAPSLKAVYPCDRALTAQLAQVLALPPVQFLTSDRLIHRVQEKLALGQTHQAQGVEMEGAAVLEFGRQTGAAVAMVRVVSDGVAHDLPDLGAALDAAGNLQPLPLALGMVRQPLAALRLIQGALIGLRSLTDTAAAISTRIERNLENRRGDRLQ